MNYIVSKFKKNINFLTGLIVLLPIFIIIGNLAINLASFLIIIIGILKFKETIIKYLKSLKIYLTILLVFFILNILFSSDYFYSLKGSLGIIRYILLSAIIFFWFNNKKDNFLLFLISIFISVFIVAVSVFVEFGYKNAFDLINDRNSGLFFDELVAGSYISKFICALLLFFVLDTRKLKLNSTSVLLILFFAYLGIFFALGRAPFIMANVGIIFFLFFTKKIKLLNKFIIILACTIIFFSSYNLNTYVKIKTDYTLYQLGFKKLIGQKSLNTFSSGGEPDNFLESKWGSHFITAYEMGKKSFIVGNGIKTFRKDCRKDEFLSKKFDQGSAAKRCSTHPHNIYFELFAETGILGLLIFFYFHFLMFKKIYYNSNTEIKIISLSIILVLFFPIQTSGSYFSTFNGIYYFLNISIINFLNNKKKITL